MSGNKQTHDEIIDIVNQQLAVYLIGRKVDLQPYHLNAWWLMENPVIKLSPFTILKQRPKLLLIAVYEALVESGLYGKES